MKYFQTSLPNPEQTGIGERATSYVFSKYWSQQAAETNWRKEEEGLQSFQTRSSEDMLQRMETAVRWKKSIKSHK